MLRPKLTPISSKEEFMAHMQKKRESEALEFNQNPTAEAFTTLAAKFDEARWGNGPGISEEDLASVGLKKQKTYRPLEIPYTVKPSEDWEGLCCYVYEKLSGGQAFPRPTARGRGFRSQQAGEAVVKLLKRLAEQA